MIITVASGKGGTGKTTVSTSLALALADALPPDKELVFADCDVEEPNAALFLSPQLSPPEDVAVLVPRIDPQLCTYCGRCAEVCEFNAIAVVGQKVLVFDEMCHGCGSCMLECPEGAISETPFVIGRTQRGSVDQMLFVQGELNIGNPMAPPIIRQVKRQAIDHDREQLVILDAPPGTSCPMAEALRDSDFALMVTEPTPFGLHDLRVAVQVARDELGLPVGVVINRDGIGDDGVDAFCQEEGIPILMRIPLDRTIAEAYSEGHPITEALPTYRQRFVALYERIQEEVSS